MFIALWQNVFNLMTTTTKFVFIMFFTYIFLLLILSIAHGCNHRDYGNGASVCVCSEQLGCDNLQLDISPVKGIVTSYRTTKAGDRFERQEYRFVDLSPKVVPIATVLLNRDVKYQKILGFGGSFTDSTGINIDSLSGSLQNRLIRDYFAEDGLEYRLGRVPIGGTDFSTRPYTYDDGQPDDDLSNFSLQLEDFLFKIPLLKKAQNVSKNQLKFVASSWSPPSWMKSNNAISMSNLKGKPGGKFYDLYAEYLVRFLQEYNRNNVTIWGLTMQNEPVFPEYIGTTANSLLMDGPMQRDFLKLNLGPELARCGYHDIKVMAFDENLRMFNFTTGEFLELMDGYVSTILEDESAANYAAGIAFHWYLNIYGNRSALDRLARKFPDKFLLSTEACVALQGVSVGNWTNFEAYADDIIQDLNHYTSGWIDWNMALDTRGGPNWVDNFVDSPIIVNATAQEYLKQPMFYALGHFSKFLVPDSVRIGHQLISDNLNRDKFLVTAFERPDSSTVLTVLNKNNNSIALLLHDPVSGFLPIFVKANSLQSFVWY